MYSALDTLIASLCRYRILEYYFQRKLRRSRAADLVQRIEAVLSAAAERGSEHLGRVAEQRRS
jgi:hypothetical protein